jgi:putative MFS transporter
MMTAHVFEATTGQGAIQGTSQTAIQEMSHGPIETLVARIERLPISRKLTMIRVIVGAATFFDAYTVLAIAFAVPQLVSEWKLAPSQVGMILSAGYAGQLIGALLFGWLAEKFGRLRILFFTIILFTCMDIACLFAWGAASMIAFRFFQGIGTGGEVPVASAYINEFIGAHRRGRFFLLYEVIFPVGLMFAGAIGYFLVPVYGWRVMFIIGLVPSILTIPLRWRELFKGLYFKRTFMLCALWLCAYLVNNGLITWLPTLYRQVFELPLQTSLAYGFTTSAFGVAASILCALFIDKAGRKPWYSVAFLLGALPLVILAYLGATSATQVLILATCAYAIIQTISFSLYLYSAELYPTRLRSIGTGLGSAWLRIGSSIGPILVGSVMVDFGIEYVFATFAVVAVLGGIVTIRFAVETKGRVLEELSP